MKLGLNVHKLGRVCLIQSQTSPYLRCLVWKTKKLIKKQTYMKT